MDKQLTVLGWREWVSLPTLGIDQIKAKVDTGAKTSALHAFNLEVIKQDNKECIQFKMHPMQNNNDYIITCVCEIIDQRHVTDSGGHKELRYVIETPIRIADSLYNIQLTLTDRETMKFRMLLGRNALNGRYLVDSSLSYQLGSYTS